MRASKQHVHATRCGMRPRPLILADAPALPAPPLAATNSLDNHATAVAVRAVTVPIELARSLTAGTDIFARAGSAGDGIVAGVTRWRRGWCRMRIVG